MSKATLPDKIYLIDPFDDGQLVENTEDVCWCADPAGDVNVGYIAEAAVAAALEELRAEIVARLFPAALEMRVEEKLVNAGLLSALTQVDATIAALGLGGTETGK